MSSVGHYSPQHSGDSTAPTAHRLMKFAQRRTTTSMIDHTQVSGATLHPHSQRATTDQACFHCKTCR